MLQEVPVSTCTQWLMVLCKKKSSHCLSRADTLRLYGRWVSVASKGTTFRLQQFLHPLLQVDQHVYIDPSAVLRFKEFLGLELVVW